MLRIGISQEKCLVFAARELAVCICYCSCQGPVYVCIGILNIDRLFSKVLMIYTDTYVSVLSLSLYRLAMLLYPRYSIAAEYRYRSIFLYFSCTKFANDVSIVTRKSYMQILFLLPIKLLQPFSSVVTFCFRNIQLIQSSDGVNSWRPFKRFLNFWLLFRRPPQILLIRQFILCGVNTERGVMICRIAFWNESSEWKALRVMSRLRDLKQ